MSRSVCVCVCPPSCLCHVSTAHCIRLGGEGNVLYPLVCDSVLCSVNIEVTKKSFNFAQKHAMPLYFLSAADGTNVVKVRHSVIVTPAVMQALVSVQCSWCTVRSWWQRVVYGSKALLLSLGGVSLNSQEAVIRSTSSIIFRFSCQAVEFAVCRGICCLPQKNVDLSIFATFLSNTRFFGLLLNFTIYKTVKSVHLTFMVIMSIMTWIFIINGPM